MKISVAVAAYCGEKFIGELLRSLLEQSTVPDEIIITDDSPDNAVGIAVKPYLAAGNIKYFHNEKTLGANRNFARALSLCRGDVIFLCDQDDVWLPEKISTMLNVLQNADDADGVFCDSTVVDSALKPLDYSLWQMREFSRSMQKKFISGRQLEVFLKRVTCSTHNIAIRRRVLDKILPFPELDPFFADTWIALCIAANGKWTLADTELTLYRTHENNLSGPELSGVFAQAQLSAKGRKKNSIRRRALIAENLLARLPENTPETVIKKITAFMIHYRKRSEYSGNFFIRSVQMLPEIFSLRYSRYANGWKSIAADLVLFR